MFRTVLVAVLVGALCFALGVRVGQDRQREAPAATTPAPIAAPAPAAATRPASPLSASTAPVTVPSAVLERRVRELEAQLAQARATPAAPTPIPAAAAHADAPVPFPADAPAAARPEGFRKLVDRVIAECKLGIVLESLDCSEYPCIAWTRARDLGVRRYDLSECAPWEEQFSGSTGLQVTTVDVNGTPERYVGFYALPPEPELRRAAVKHVRERTQAMTQTFGNGARP